MPRPRNPHPKVLRDKATGQAKCWYYDPGSGKRRGVTLGPWGSAEAEAAHARLLAALRDGTAPAPTTGPGLTVAALAARYLAHADSYYRSQSGQRTSEYAHVRLAVAVLADTDAALLAVTAFGPAAFKAVRQAMVAKGWGRDYVNAQARRLKGMLRWGVENELCPAAVWQALAAVRGLGKGRSIAPESEPVTPATAWQVGRTIPYLSATIAAMVRFQWFTGCRPQDVCQLRVEDLDRAGAVWVYRPHAHKTAWRGKARLVFIGPKAQALLGPWLNGIESGPVFSPRRAVASQHADRSRRRVTPRYPSHLERNAAKRATRPRRMPGEQYTTGSYDKAVRRACLLAGVEPWSPNQIRHSAATRFREKFGLELTRTLLGHGQTSTSEIYAEKPTRQAAEAMRKVG